MIQHLSPGGAGQIRQAGRKVYVQKQNVIPAKPVLSEVEGAGIQDQKPDSYPSANSGQALRGNDNKLYPEQILIGGVNPALQTLYFIRGFYELSLAIMLPPRQRRSKLSEPISGVSALFERTGNPKSGSTSQRQPLAKPKKPQ